MGKDRPKHTAPADRVEYNEAAHRSFLLSVKHSKKQKAKRAEKLAKETLRKVRADRRHQRKEEREQVVRDLVKKQTKLGIQSLPLYTESHGSILFAEVDAANPTEVKLAELEITKDTDASSLDVAAYVK
jgi:hypothetical protein